ncbi:hypothetical protein BO78DRAFT_356249 [Aspergillus sclerotiicarbonarius CBS 121057]|uniref:C2H2-type domain-containing protein n=1 Tax=Aspergillus sclerotiicarbonarius (strain CBS 121057 / IBT 28362) TaxID=1448318 RepID=A0A319F7T3_ASPSB|nr:hypothetical protein BO78DRAFT_356249 [Aspergillus sclerotiicarbonarius CBS 121057]
MGETPQDAVDYRSRGSNVTNRDGSESIDPALLRRQSSLAEPLDSQLFPSYMTLPTAYDGRSHPLMPGESAPLSDWLFDDLNLPQSPIIRPEAQQHSILSEVGGNHHYGNGNQPDISTVNPARQLPRRRSRYLTRNQQASPIVIPNASTLDPMERWRNSPPEEEPALIPDILDALKTAPQDMHGSRNSNPFRHYRRAASTTSGESSASSRDSQQSGRSSSSAQNPLAVQGRRRRIRVGKPTPKQSSIKEQRRYCCTFCCDRFKSKYDWARHEKSLHVTLEAWYCAPFGATILSPTHETCAFCGAIDPDSAHLLEHAAAACESESGTRRSFRRKDHLVQHLRLVHNVTPPRDLDSWKIGQPAISSRCGICNQALRTWEQRVDHLAEHFRTGSTMADWRGEHEFPPGFAAQVVNALPPYLIGSESSSLIPFSATNCDVQDHFAQISSRARWDSTDQEANEIVAPVAPSVPLPLQTIAPGVAPEQLSSFTQVLTLHLSRFAQEQMKRGVVPSDELFQQESRRLLYDSEDTWNQTIADNPEWLSAFRGLHCDKSESPPVNP